MCYALYSHYAKKDFQVLYGRLKPIETKLAVCFSVSKKKSTAK